MDARGDASADDAVPNDNLSPMTPRRWSLIGLVIGVAGIVFVIRTIVREWDAVVDAWETAVLGWVAVAVAFGLAAMTWIGVRWLRMMHRSLSPRAVAIPLVVQLRLYFAGQLGKYVPGGIWPVVGRAELAVRAGIDRRIGYGTSVLSLAATYGAAAVVGALGAAIAYSNWYRPVALGVLAAAALAMWFVHTDRVPATLARRVPLLPRLPIEILLHVPAWVLLSASTWCSGRALGVELAIAEALAITGAGWLIGFVAIGVPGGIGVREAVFIALMEPSVGVASATAIAVLARLVAIAVDVVGAVASHLLAAGRRVSEGV